jgi:hypothetical protein
MSNSPAVVVWHPQTTVALALAETEVTPVDPRPASL